MGPAAQASTQSNGSTFQHATELFAFPSPASVHGSLNTPTLESRVKPTQILASNLSARDALLGTADIVPTEPDDVQNESVLTPPADEMPQHDMDLAVGGALAPVHSALPPRPVPKRARPAFRLPSFQSLGIANPNPDRFGLDGNATETMLPTSLRHRGQRADTPTFLDLRSLTAVPIQPEPNNKLPGGRSMQSPVHQLVHTLTPPEDLEYPDWRSVPTITTTLDSPSTDPGNAPGEALAQDAVVSSQPGFLSRESALQAETDGVPSWIRGAVNTLGERL